MWISCIAMAVVLMGAFALNIRLGTNVLYKAQKLNQYKFSVTAKSKSDTKNFKKGVYKNQKIE